MADKSKEQSHAGVEMHARLDVWCPVCEQVHAIEANVPMHGADTARTLLRCTPFERYYEVSIGVRAWE